MAIAGPYRNREYPHIGGAEADVLIAIEAKARAAFTANNTFIALASPTAAQVAAQAKLLSREVNGLLRLLLGDFSADDT